MGPTVGAKLKDVMEQNILPQGQDTEGSEDEIEFCDPPYNGMHLGSEKILTVALVSTAF